MRIKSEKDFWSGLMFVAIGVAFAWGATAYDFGSPVRPGPAYFPFGLGILMAVLGTVVLFGALTVDTADGEPIGPWPFRQGVLILGAVILFGLLLPRLGIALALPLLIGISSLASGEFRWREVLANSLVLTLGSWAVFVRGLGLIIPVWPPMLVN